MFLQIFFTMSIILASFLCECEGETSLFQKCVICTEAGRSFEVDIKNFEGNCGGFVHVQRFDHVTIFNKGKCTVLLLPATTPNPTEAEESKENCGTLSSNLMYPSYVTIIAVIEGYLIFGLLLAIVYFSCSRRPNPRRPIGGGPISFLGHRTSNAQVLGDPLQPVRPCPFMI